MNMNIEVEKDLNLKDKKNVLRYKGDDRWWNINEKETEMKWNWKMKCKWNGIEWTGNTIPMHLNIQIVHLKLDQNKTLLTGPEKVLKVGTILVGLQAFC